MTWELFAALLGMFGSFSTLMFWLMSRLENRIHGDVTRLCERMDETNKRIDTTGARIDAMGARIDAMGIRIDTTQSIIMRMLEKSSKTG